MYGYDDNEIGPTPIKLLGKQKKPITKSGTGDAAKDGYTVLQKAAPWGMPGDMVSVEEAERYEKLMGETPMADDY